MNLPKIPTWSVWLLPVCIGSGMALGAFLGLSAISDTLGQAGPDGDQAGAFGVLVILICFSVGTVMAALTMIIAKFCRRKTFVRILFRFGSNVLAGIAIGALAMNESNPLPEIAWVLTICLPILLSWPSPNRSEPKRIP